MSTPSSHGPKIYLSAVRGELDGVRKSTASLLKSRGMEVVLAPDDVSNAVARLHELRMRMAQADEVIVIAGFCAGDAPPAPALSAVLQSWESETPGFSHRLGLEPTSLVSYTQLEARMAFALGKEVHAFVLAESFPADKVAPEPQTMKILQGQHRAILQSISAASLHATPKALHEALQSLPFPASSAAAGQTSRFRLTGLTLRLAVYALLCAGVWHYRSSLQPGDAAGDDATVAVVSPESLDAQQLVYQIACLTLQPALPGDYATTDERQRKALEMVAAKTGMASTTLKATVIDPWVRANGGARPEDAYTFALVMFWGKDYRAAQRALVKAFEADTWAPDTGDGRKYQACVLEAAAAYMRGDVAGADRALRRGWTYPERHRMTDAKATQEERRAQYHAGMTDEMRQYFRLTHLAQKLGKMHVPNHTWQHDFMSTEQVGELTSEEILTIMCLHPLELAESGKSTEAVAAAERAVRAVEKLHGPGSWTMVHAQCMKAKVHVELGQADEAQKAMTRALTIQRESFAKDARLQATVSQAYAQMALTLGRANQAEPAAREAYDQRLKVYDTWEPAMLESARVLGQSQLLTGESEKALMTLIQAQASTEQVMGRNNLPWLLVTRDVAMARRMTGDLAGAYKDLQVCLELHRELQMTDGVDAATTHHYHGLVCNELAYFQGAAVQQQEALLILQKKVGPDHPALLRVLCHLGGSISDAGEHERGDTILRQVLAQYEKQKTPPAVDLAQTHFHLARSLSTQKRYEEALGHFQRAMAVCERNFPHPSVQQALVLQSHARCLSGLGNYLEAQGLLGRADQMLITCTPEHHWVRSRGHLFAGATLADEGRGREAFERFGLAWVGFRANLGPENGHTALAWRLLCATTMGVRDLPTPPPQPMNESPMDVVAHFRILREANERETRFPPGSFKPRPRTNPNPAPDDNSDAKPKVKA